MQVFASKASTNIHSRYSNRTLAKTATNAKLSYLKITQHFHARQIKVQLHKPPKWLENMYQIKVTLKQLLESTILVSDNR
jgi:hypothetical protein